MADMERNEGSSTSEVSGGSSESTLELNIKTLDSRIYSFHVHKNMVVSAFKEKIASQSGVPVALQRLIFRGKVLKDDHLLSEYHVENGDTFHLVERQPQPPAGSRSSTGEATSSNGNAGQDPSIGHPRPRIGQISHSVVVGALNLGEAGEAASPDIGQVIGGILNSIGIGGLGGAIPPGGGVMPLGVQASHGNETEGSRNNAGSQNQGGNQSVPLQGLHGQFAPHPMQIPLGAPIPIPTLNMPIPDSVDTLVEFMNRMEQYLPQSGDQPNQSPASSDQQPTTQLPRSARGVPTIEALSIVLRQAECLLSSNVVPELSNTAGRLEQEGGSIDPSVRGQLLTESAHLGVAMQHIGALLLELGRTILTLRMGQSPAESFVNAGPAVYISSSGPNPIMVQPFPLQTSSLFGGLSGPAPNPMFMGPIGAGSISRNVNIHIHTGASLAPIIPRVANGTQEQSTSETEPGNSAQTPVFPTSVPLRPVVIPLSGVMPPGSTVPHASSGSNPISSMVAQINSQLSRNLTSNVQNGNNATSGQLRGSTDQGQSAGTDGDNDMDIHQKDLPTSGVGETGQTLCRESNIKETEDTNANTEISTSVPERAENLESLARPIQGNNPDSSSGGVPLGLGLGGLQPKKQGKQPKSQTKNSDNASTSIQNSGVLGSVPTGRQTADGPIDMADAMSQFLEDPAMNGLLSGVAQQTGVGSPDMFRNMLQQFTRNPAMRNTVNQIAQQIDSHGLGDMMADLGRGGEGGGIDLSRMMQQMLPMVSQALGGGLSSAAPPPPPPQITNPIENVLSESRSRREAGRVNSDPQIDLGQVVERLENQSSSQEIFRSLGNNVVHFVGNDRVLEGAVNELCTEGGLVQEFMEMLKNDISQRFEGEMGS